MNEQLSPLAAVLRRALEQKTPCAPLTSSMPSLSVEDAYAIQAHNVAQRLACGLDGKPARLVGHKIGITSRAVMNWLQVDQPDFGCLLSDMVVPHGGTAETSWLVQPRVEGEVAFVLRRRLAGPGVTAADVLAATDFLLPALEIIDSRIADWKITYPDTIADNASSGLFVLGSDPVRPHGVELDLAGMVLRKNGRVVSTGVGAACLDHPVNAVVWLANKLGEMGHMLEPGHVILSGALGPVAPVSSGDEIEVEIAHVGRCSVRFA
ncbi:MAG: 2-keto-4-pentenoate hydratase [Myxococcota bacterium]